MLAVATYIEEVKPGWRSYDKYLLHNLDLAFNVDRHYWIVRYQDDTDWYYGGYTDEGRPNKESFDHLALSMSWIIEKLKVEEPEIELINVQPYERIKHLKTAQPIYDFQHPDNACYLFGPNHGDVVIANTINNIWIDAPGSYLYSASAVAVVLASRFNFGCH